MDLIAKAKQRAMSNEKDGETSGNGRDLLSLLVKANMTADGLKLSDDAVLARTLLHLTMTNPKADLPPNRFFYP
jgi:hypothetical protein